MNSRESRSEGTATRMRELGSGNARKGVEHGNPPGDQPEGRGLEPAFPLEPMMAGRQSPAGNPMGAGLTSVPAEPDAGAVSSSRWNLALEQGCPHEGI